MLCFLARVYAAKREEKSYTYLLEIVHYACLSFVIFLRVSYGLVLEFSRAHATTHSVYMYVDLRTGRFYNL